MAPRRPAAAAVADIPVATVDELLGRDQRTRDVIITLDDGSQRMLHFANISPHEFDALETAHPASDAEHERAGYRLRWSRRTFVPALIAECSVAPKLTADQVDEFLASKAWSVEEVNRLFDTCMDLCSASSVVALGKGSAPTTGSASASASASSAASRGASSTAA